MTFDEWVEKFGEQYIVPKYTPNKFGVSDMDRCSKLARTKNAKIADRNNSGFLAYLEKEKPDLSVLSVAEAKSHAYWLSVNLSVEAANEYLCGHPSFEKKESGLWGEK